MIKRYSDSADGQGQSYRIEFAANPNLLESIRNKLRPGVDVPTPRPNSTAKSKTIGLLCRGYEWYALALMKGAEAAAREAGLSLVVAFDVNDQLDFEIEQLSSLLSRCSGVIVAPIRTPSPKMLQI